MQNVQRPFALAWSRLAAVCASAPGHLTGLLLGVSLWAMASGAAAQPADGDYGRFVFGPQPAKAVAPWWPTGLSPGERPDVTRGYRGGDDEGGFLTSADPSGAGYLVVSQAEPDLALVLGAGLSGADVAQDPWPGYLSPQPAPQGQLRAGLSQQHGDLSVFYGMTWVGRELSGWPSSRLLGALHLQLRF